jgi:hypothetical protein
VALHESVLAFSCDRTRTEDVLVVAVENAAEGIRWPMHSCSPLDAGANTSYSSKHSNSKRVNTGPVSVAADGFGSALAPPSNPGTGPIGYPSTVTPVARTVVVTPYGTERGLVLRTEPDRSLIFYIHLVTYVVCSPVM